jgi:alkyldihydroxyacetonephosphate synthase
LPPSTVRKLGEAIGGRFGWNDIEIREPARVESLSLRAPRVAAPSALAEVCSTETFDRAAHTYGKSYRDVVRGFRGELPAPPDVVAFPRDENDVVALLDWCAGANVAAIPYGGGSSVVGGVEAGLVDDSYAGVACIDLTRLDRVLEVDDVSRAARIQGGALGPVLEDQLRQYGPHGYTLRHFPQSFEFSTLGGWLATRSGGHYASVYTHIDDLVESIRTVTPCGIAESRRLPGSGAGPSPDRLALGSEGTLGVITEAWMRVQDRVRFKASAGVRFASYDDAVAATRAVSQSGLFPTNCRLLDATEAMIAAGVQDGTNLLVLGFESADHPVHAWIERAVELCQDHGGTVPEGVTITGPGPTGPDRPERISPGDTRSAGRDGAAGAWRNSFLRAPYGRDALVSMAVIVETFETACTWAAFPDLHAGVVAGVQRALEDVCGKGSGGWVTCRFTHVYPDGPAPYFSVTAPGRFGSELEMWRDIKAAASEILLAHGGTITHHHAVGRDHRPWYDRQRPDVFASALVAAKHALDPAGVLNPGVLIDPR